MGNFKEHGVMLYLSKDLYSGWIKLQAEKNLGRTFAGLLPFTEGLFRLGYISREIYELHLKKYSEPISDVEHKVLNPEQQREKQFLDDKERQLKGMLEVWDLEHFTPNWHEKAIHEAKKYPDLASAKAILRKARENDFKF